MAFDTAMGGALHMTNELFDLGIDANRMRIQADENMRLQNHADRLARRNFKDSAMLSKVGAISAGMNPLGQFEQGNITTSPTSVGGTATSSNFDWSGALQRDRQIENETKIADSQQKLLDEQRRGIQIDNDRKVGYDTALEQLNEKYPELDFEGLSISNKGVFDAITGYENLRRDVVNNKRLNEEDRLYYDALSKIKDNPELKSQFETFVFENYRNIKVINEKLLSDIDLNKASIKEIASKIRNLDEDTIYKTMLENLTWEQSRYYCQMTNNLIHESDWELLTTGLDEYNEDSAKALATLAIKHGNIDGIAQKLIDIPSNLLNAAIELFKFKEMRKAFERLNNLNKDKFDFDKLKFENRPKGDKTSTTEKFDAKGNFAGGSTTHTTTR